MEDVLPWPGNANMAFDLQPTGDVLPWPDNANMAFDLRPTEDVLSWPGNANMAFDLRPTRDVLPWPGNANMAFDLLLDLKCLLLIIFLKQMGEDGMQLLNNNVELQDGINGFLPMTLDNAIPHSGVLVIWNLSFVPNMSLLHTYSET
nr:hypothetical protein [Tanacetum cinerariifolium]GEY00002.1 hypothetical protein [Tanacetum cinerariifolium]